MGIADTDGWHAEFIIPGENTNQLAILFTIAHELGHLNWRNAWNKNPDPSACFKSLLGLSWSSTVDGNGVDARARPWTDYGDDVGLIKAAYLSRTKQHLPNFEQSIRAASLQLWP